jgi:CheY-like chemotaxis protein
MQWPAGYTVHGFFGKPDGEALMRKKVLVIDDEPDVRKFLTAVLEKHGYDTLTASDGTEALEIARREKPDLVTLDLQMPHGTGTDFYRKFSRSHEYQKTPVIVVSGLAGRDLAVKKPVAVFDKPIDPDEFIAAVRKALPEE